PHTIMDPSENPNSIHPVIASSIRKPHQHLIPSLFSPHPPHPPCLIDHVSLLRNSNLALAVAKR
ncbi:hypothetical protein U1Q18_014177, partial [Sarracenia purpurea var. burkii]